MDILQKTFSIRTCALLGVMTVVSIQDISTWIKICTIVGAFFLSGNTESFYLLYHTLPRDLSAVSKLFRLIVLLKKHEWFNTTVPKMFSATAARVPNKPMFFYNNHMWTFGQVEDLSNRIANYILSEGFGRGDTVAVYIGNRPEFVIVWLGLSKAGVVPALINYNLKQEALIHSTKVADCKALIFGVELQGFVKDVFHKLGNGSKILPSYFVGSKDIENIDIVEVPQSKNLDNFLKDFSNDPVPTKVKESVCFNDKFMYIYTSGTTGLPKAALIKHSRYILAGEAATLMMGLNKEDTIYCCLPLYHTVGGMIALSGTMRRAIPMVIADRFSSSNFWKDCVKHGVTAAPYIGEICRYLLNTHKCDEEKQHSLRLMFGNGLRPSIWKDFVDRFGIGQIREFYGSTEGNSNIINLDNTVGAVGFIPLATILGSILPLGLIKVTEDGEAIRNADTGLCIRCEPGEEGEFVGVIVNNHPVRDFPGYSDLKATTRKIIHNVWKQGDNCFRSGDILVCDKFGYFYFKDRKGDTFRWKGENVSTAEVESVVFGDRGAGTAHMDVVAYGVKLPGYDGKAGMMALAQIPRSGGDHLELDHLDLDYLSELFEEKLPSYARPVFLRITRELDITGTYKLKKRALQEEGINPHCQDPIFYFDIKTNKYLPLLKDVFENIMCQKIRF